MVEMSAIYLGDKHCELQHGPSKSKIETDAPKDNNGRGENFSPTDLVGAALASCILTTMAIMAEKDGLSIKGAKARVTKEMQASPRQIAKLPVTIEMPAGLSATDRKRLEAAAHTCPVHRSLNSDVQAPISFNYPD
jgi:putative redox protein